MRFGPALVTLIVCLLPWLGLYALIWGDLTDVLTLVALAASVFAWAHAEPDPLGESL